MIRSAVRWVAMRLGMRPVVISNVRIARRGGGKVTIGADLYTRWWATDEDYMAARARVLLMASEKNGRPLKLAGPVESGPM